MQEGKVEEAFRIDYEFISQTFPGKYGQALDEMMAYTRQQGLISSPA